MRTSARVPLSVGLASLRSSARVASLVWPSLFLFVGAVAVAPGIGALLGNGMIASVVGVVLMVVVVLGAIFGFAIAAGAGDEAKRERPSDLVMDAEGLRVEGGRHDGVRLMWGAIRSARVVELPKAEKQGLRHMVLWLVTLGQVSRFARRVFALQLGTKAGKDIVLAESDDAEETASMRALAETIDAMRGGEEQTSDFRLQTSEKAPDTATLLSCGECGAALGPADVESVKCAFCGKETRVPEELRARIRAPEEVARGLRAERKIGRLLSQPGARSGGALLTLFRWIGHLVWPAAITIWILVAVAMERGSTAMPMVRIVDGYGKPWIRAMVLSLAVAPVVLAAVGLTVAAFLANRRALRLVSLSFGAVPPVREGAPSSCRNCAAPLPSRPGRVVVGCLSCGTENVLGLDLRVPARRVKAHERSVMAALRHRFRARLRLAATAVVAVAAVWWLGRELVWTARIPPPRSSSHYCFACTTTVLEKAGRGRRVTVADEGGTSRVYIPAGATAAIDCHGPCRVEQRKMWP